MADHRTNGPTVFRKEERKEENKIDKKTETSKVVATSKS